jgi:hypothetical protein
MKKFFVLFASFFQLVFSEKFMFRLYYSNTDCHDDDGYGVISFEVFEINETYEEPCTVPFSSDDWLPDNPSLKSSKVITLDFDSWPTLYEMVPSKSQYYTIQR